MSRGPEGGQEGGGQGAGGGPGAWVVGNLGPLPPSHPRVTGRSLSSSASLPPPSRTLHAALCFHSAEPRRECTASAGTLPRSARESYPSQAEDAVSCGIPRLAERQVGYPPPVRLDLRISLAKLNMNETNRARNFSK